MIDPRHEKLADVLVRYSTRVKKGELVGIRADATAMPLIIAVQRACLKAGANCVLLCQPEEWIETLVESGTEEQVAWPSPMMQWYIDTVDVSIGFWAETNPKFMTRYDPRRAALLQQARRPFLKTFMQREAEGTLRWCGTQYPTSGAAQDAEMSLRQYEDFVYKAGLLHLPDPVGAWQKVFDSQERVREYLQGKKTLRFQVPAYGDHDGTDLTVDCSKSTWINCGGRENFPDGEVFAGPGAVDGHVNYTFPAVYQGREVQGVRLKFKGGRVVEASAKKGEDFLFKMLDQDPGARNLGEIAIGTNYGITEFSRNTLFDEKIGGTFHAAVGAGYPKSGNSNESGLHWDMVCDMRPGKDRPGGTISADGEVFHKDGLFTRAGWPGPTT